MCEIECDILQSYYSIININYSRHRQVQNNISSKNPINFILITS